VDHTLQALRLAKELGCQNISTEPGGLRAEMKEEAQALAWFQEGSEQVLPVAEELKMKLLIEPEPGCLIETPRQMVDFLFSLPPSHYLGMNADLGHFYCVGQDPSQVLRGYASFSSTCMWKTSPPTGNTSI